MNVCQIPALGVSCRQGFQEPNSRLFFVKRQQDIVSRLLKSEKAEREREQDNQRRSTEARNAPVSTPEEYEEYRKRKEQEVELLRTLPPSLKSYYKGKVNEYFNKLDGQ